MKVKTYYARIQTLRVHPILQFLIHDAATIPSREYGKLMQHPDTTPIKPTTKLTLGDRILFTTGSSLEPASYKMLTISKV